MIRFLLDSIDCNLFGVVDNAWLIDELAVVFCVACVVSGSDLGRSGDGELDEAGGVEDSSPESIVIV
jgi:hypothetical protein